jgi:hypothetical protein
MKFNEIITNVIYEEIKNKKLFNALMDKWKMEKPNLSPDEAETLITSFQRIQNGLKPEKPQVFSFLNRFDGQHGTQRFDPANLKDITKYGYKEISSLIGEYTDDEENVGGDAFADKDTKPTPEKIEASKQLWEGEENLIINEEGFRVYDIKDQKMSVKYGYYAETINRSHPGSNSPWCVTWRNDQGRTNMWGSYRNNRSFYFVIDESRDPSDRYYLSALQRDTDVRTGFRLTSVRNDGDQVLEWNEIIEIYPKLADHKDSIKPKAFTQDELEEKNAVGQVTEREGSPYEFKRVDRNLKRAYINNLGSLKKPESWRSMDEKLRALYILTTTSNDARDKFSNFDFLNEIKKVGSEFTLLDNRLKQLDKGGVGYIYDHLMSTEFRVARVSADNEKIRLYESKINGKSGLYNTRTTNWVQMNGTTYEPLYELIDTDLFFDDEGETYVVETFSKSMQPSNDSFYSVYLVSDSNPEFNSHFLSATAWEKLKSNLKSEDEDVSKKPGEETDIKEYK